MAVFKYRRSSDGVMVELPLPKGDTGDRGDTGPAGGTGDQGPTGGSGPKGPNHTYQLRIGGATIQPVADTNTQSGPVYYSAPFNNDPTVVLAMRTNVAGNQYRNAAVDIPARDHFRWWVYRTNTTSSSMDWFAVGLRG